jgi:hypothetical protein
MEVKATLLHCSKIGAQLSKLPSDNIKNSKLFQSINHVELSFNFIRFDRRHRAPTAIPKAC